MVGRLVNALRSKGLRKVWRMVIDRAWILFYRTFGIRYVVRAVQDFEMILDLEDRGVCSWLLKYEVREPEHKFLLERELRPGMTVLDCGANIGYYALLMGKRVGDTGRILAIEPAPYNYHLLNLNVLLNNMDHVIKTINVGAAAQSGESVLHLSKHSNCHTFHPASHRKNIDAPLVGTVAVQVLSIADFVKEYGRFELVRTDTEGFEVEILEGLLPALSDQLFRPKILFETHPYSYDDDLHNIRRPLQALFCSGYFVKYVVADLYTKKAARAFREKGYGEKHVIATFTENCDRGIYINVSNEDAVDFALTDMVRAIMLDVHGR